MIAPKIADITETITNVKAHPSSPAASVMDGRKKKGKEKREWERENIK